MFRLSKKMLYAIETVVDIAYHGQADPVQSKEITRRQGIPQRYLEQVMQQLVRANILKGVRGPRGGYNLARERRRITVGEIVSVIRDMEKAKNKAYESESALGGEVVKPLLEELNKDIMQSLNNVTIQDLCRTAQEKGIASESSRSFDYTI